MHLLVAGGMAEIAMEDDLSIWDVAALEIIVTEAGGRMSGWDGSSVLTSGTALSTNGQLHDEMMRRLTA
jgi:histidinol-phosphatase